MKSMEILSSVLGFLFSLQIAGSSPLLSLRSTRQDRSASASSSAGAGTTNNGNFGIGAAAGIGGVGASSGIGSFAADTRTDPFLPFGAFAGINFPRAGRFGAGCSGLSCGFQFGDFVAQLPFISHSGAGGDEDDYGDEERVELIAKEQPAQEYLVKDYHLVKDSDGKQYAVKEYATIVKDPSSGKAVALNDYAVVKDAAGKEYVFIKGNDPRIATAGKNSAIVGLKASTLVTPGARNGVNGLLRGIFGGFRDFGDTLTGFFPQQQAQVIVQNPVKLAAVKTATTPVLVSPSPIVYLSSATPQYFAAATSSTPNTVPKSASGTASPTPKIVNIKQVQ